MGPVHLDTHVVVWLYAGLVAWTRDPFDRLIAGHAIAADHHLLTKDRTLRANLELACRD